MKNNMVAYITVTKDDFGFCSSKIPLHELCIILLCCTIQRSVCNTNWNGRENVVVVVFYVHGRQLKSCRDGQLTEPHFSWAGFLGS